MINKEKSISPPTDTLLVLEFENFTTHQSICLIFTTILSSLTKKVIILKNNYLFYKINAFSLLCYGLILNSGYK